MNKKAYICVRTQCAKGTWPRQGPDTYVAVQIVPEGLKPLKVLNRSVAEKRGIEIVYCGEGYSNRIGKRSMFGQALATAQRIAKDINGG